MATQRADLSSPKSAVVFTHVQSSLPFISRCAREMRGCSVRFEEVKNGISKIGVFVPKAKQPKILSFQKHRYLLVMMAGFHVLHVATASDDIYRNCRSYDKCIMQDFDFTSQIFNKYNYHNFDKFECHRCILNSIPMVSEYRELHLINCTLRQLNASDFPQWNELRHLNLTYNELTHIDSQLFETAQWLLYLDLSHNRIEHVAVDAFDNPHLVQLYLNDNRLTVFQSNVPPMLQVLHLQNNRIER